MGVRIQRLIHNLRSQKQGVGGMGSYEGRLQSVSRNNDFGFIPSNSIRRKDGESDLRISRLRGDIFLHVKNNRDLPVPLYECRGEKISFEIDFEHPRSNGTPLIHSAQLVYRLRRKRERDHV